MKPRPLDLQPIRDRAAKATPGPDGRSWVDECRADVVRATAEMAADICFTRQSILLQAYGDLIRALDAERQDIPALLAEVDRQRAEVARLTPVVRITDMREHFEKPEAARDPRMASLYRAMRGPWGWSIDVLTSLHGWADTKEQAEADAAKAAE